MAEKKTPEKPALSDPVTLRLPLDILEDVEKIAETADRSRSWVIVRALKYYLMAEGAEMLSIRRGLEDLEAGRTVDAEELFSELDRLNREDAT